MRRPRPSIVLTSAARRLLLVAGVSVLCGACAIATSDPGVTVGGSAQAAEPEALMTTPSYAGLKALLLTTSDVPAPYRVAQDSDNSTPEPTDLPHPIANECDRTLLFLGDEGRRRTVDREFTSADHRWGISHELTAYDTPTRALATLYSWQAFAKQCGEFEYVDAGDRYLVRIKASAEQPARPNAFAADFEQTMPDTHETPAVPAATRHIVIDVVGTVVSILGAGAQLAATVTTAASVAREKLAAS